MGLFLLARIVLATRLNFIAEPMYATFHNSQEVQPWLLLHCVGVGFWRYDLDIMLPGSYLNRRTYAKKGSRNCSSLVPSKLLQV
jgi:hypothetical protein